MLKAKALLMLSSKGLYYLLRCSRRDSNPHQLNRNQQFYPLNYGNICAKIYNPPTYHQRAHKFSSLEDNYALQTTAIPTLELFLTNIKNKSSFLQTNKSLNM
jgi:hypothetical protein